MALNGQTPGERLKENCRQNPGKSVLQRKPTNTHGRGWFIDYHQFKKMIAFFLVGLFLWGGIGAQAADVSTHALGAKKQTLSSSTDAVKAGYYSATRLSNINANLSEPNIKSGVSIFGKSGTFTIVLPKTGQTAVIHPATPPDDPGDDGMLQKGFSGTRFHDNGNFTVTDNATQLMWQKCSVSGSEPDDSCSSFPGIYPWDEVEGTEDAFTKVAELNQSGFAGYTTGGCRTSRNSKAS